jgi:hypothetical protein
MIKEIKKCISLLLLKWSFEIMPDCKFKKSLANLFKTELLNGMD